MPDLSISIPSSLEFQGELDTISQQRVSKISTEQEYHAAGERLLGIRSLRERIETAFKKPVKDATAALESIRGLRNELLEPLERERLILDTARQMYEREHESRRAQVAEALRHSLPKLSKDLGIAFPSLAPDLPKLQKTPGISSGKRYYARVRNLWDLINAVAKGDLPQEALLPNLIYLNKLATSNKTALNIPGVEVYAKTSTRTRVK